VVVVPLLLLLLLLLLCCRVIIGKSYYEPYGILPEATVRLCAACLLSKPSICHLFIMLLLLLFCLAG
jgi:hypothetical protein